MPTNLLLLPLLAGFWFVNRCWYFKFRVQRLDGYWLLLESSIAGVVFLTIGRACVLSIEKLPGGFWLRDWWGLFSPFPFSGTAAASLCVGLVTPSLVNGISGWFGGIERVRSLAIQRHGTDLDKLLNTAIQSQRKVSLTLSSRKWYVGYVSRAPNLSPREAWVSILPIMSGYRDPETLETEVTTDYIPIYEGGVDRTTFTIIVPIAAITSAGFFDDAVYVKFREPDSGDLNDPA